MSNELFCKFCRQAESRLVGRVSRDVACDLHLDGAHEPVLGYNGSKLEEYYQLLEEQEDKNMDEDHDFILYLTGNKGQSPFIPDEDDDMDGCEKLSWEDRLGLSVQERAKEQRWRNLLEMLRFQHFDMYGNHNPVVSIDPSTGMREYSIPATARFLRQRFVQYGPYIEKMVGKRNAKWFFRELKKRLADHEEAVFQIQDILGLAKEELPQVGTKRPGRAFFQEHKLDKEVNGHRPDDGRFSDEVDDRGWKQNEDGSWEPTGYPMMYQRKNGELVQVMTDKGLVKVLNVNVCKGDKPNMHFTNLHEHCWDPCPADRDPMEHEKRLMLRREMLRRYQKAMFNRDESIKDCQNGRFRVFYMSMVVDGNALCVFSPMPMRALSDKAQKRVQAEIKRREELKKFRDGMDQHFV